MASFRKDTQTFGPTGFAVPIVITEKSDIDVRATTRDKNGRYTVAFDILLVDN
jgi:hypothetical protein